MTKNGGWLLAYKKPFETIFFNTYFNPSWKRKHWALGFSSHIDRSISLSIIGNWLKEGRCLFPQVSCLKLAQTYIYIGLHIYMWPSTTSAPSIVNPLWFNCCEGTTIEVRTMVTYLDNLTYLVNLPTSTSHYLGKCLCKWLSIECPRALSIAKDFCDKVALLIHQILIFFFFLVLKIVIILQ